MEWEDQGIVLSVRRHGESSAILSVFTSSHGRCLGLVKGGMSKGQKSTLQKGNLLAIKWRARLEAHLGTFSCNLLRSNAMKFMDDALKISVLNSACSVVDLVLPEREGYQNLYLQFFSLIDNLSESRFIINYIFWEIDLLQSLGFGLDLSRCCVSGEKEDLFYLSPKTGRAVSEKKGKPYHDRLFPLPSFLISRTNSDSISSVEIKNAFNITTYFLGRYVFGVDKKEPWDRKQLVDRLIKMDTMSSS